MKKAWVLAVSMWVTAVVCWAWLPRSQPVVNERATVPLERLFPADLPGWQLDPLAAAPVRPAFEQARRFQMYDQVLERTYVNAAGYRIMLSVAYGRQQSVGLQMHRPEVCYKAGGFRVEAVESTQITVGHRPLAVTRLFASMEGRPEPVTYWRLLGDEVVTDESQFRWRQLSHRVSDGLLVRVSSIDADRAGAYGAQAAFIEALASRLDRSQSQRVLGWGQTP
ncbi:MAG: exosortase C-terminal domain/associated protein EpsI [Acidobacteriota bacterium]